MPNLNGYRDRAHLIGKIARKIGKAVLVVSRIDVELEEIELDPHLELIEAHKGARFLDKTPFAASRVVESLLRKDHFNIVHDTFGYLIPLFLRRRMLPRCVFVTSQFILAEWDFRNFFWFRFGLKSIKYHNLRVWMLRILIQRIIFSLSDCIVVQAPGLIERLKQYPHLKKTTVTWLPNNISQPLICRQAMPVTKRADSTIRLLYMRPFSVDRGADALLDLLGRARKRNIQVQATIVGGFAAIDERYLKNRINRLNMAERLIIYGWVSRDMINSFYDNNDWLFLLSNVDGSPRVALEALSRGLPVIGSSHPGITVLDPGRQFILFADPLQLDTLLDELINSKRYPDRYVNRSVRGLSYMRKHFSSEAVSERYVDLYMSLIEGVQNENT